MIKLPFGFKACLLLTDIGFLTYWAVSAFVLVGLLNIPGEWLFNDYFNPIVFAWNWSFMPLDVILSILGIVSLRLLARGNGSWKPLLLVSMSLTFCAGLMAISFWAIRGEFDISWWAANLFLMIWPMIYFWQIIRVPSEEK